jgi:hypothetical protein
MKPVEEGNFSSQLAFTCNLKVFRDSWKHSDANTQQQLTLYFTVGSKKTFV